MSKKTNKDFIFDGFNRKTGEEDDIQSLEGLPANLGNDPRPSAKKLQFFPVNEIEIVENIRKDYRDLEELAESIRKYGLIQSVRISSTKNKNGKYTLISGHRRFKAISEILKYENISVTMEEEGREIKSETDRIENQLIENIQRDDISDKEIADAINQLKKVTGSTNKQIGEILHKTEGWIKSKIDHAILFEGLPANLWHLSSTLVNETKGLPDSKRIELLGEANKNDWSKSQLREAVKTEKGLSTNLGNSSPNKPSGKKNSSDGANHPKDPPPRDINILRLRETPLHTYTVKEMVMLKNLIQKLENDKRDKDELQSKIKSLNNTITKQKKDIGTLKATITKLKKPKK